jgi:hypothetical protein
MMRKLIGLTGALLVITSVFGLNASGAELEGYAVLTTAAGLSMIYDQPSAPIPTAPRPTGEFHVSYATATLESGPVGHAIGSAVWPGPPAANVGNFARDSATSQFLGGCTGGCPRDQFAALFAQLPSLNYPVRAETFSPQGPFDAHNGAPGLADMSSHAKDFEADATSSVASGSLPGVVSAGVMFATGRSLVEDGKAVAEATSSVKGINLLGGLITADSVVSTAKAVSDGATATVSGRTVIHGFKIQGQGFDIDDKGFHSGNQNTPVASVINDNAKAYLDQAGITLLVAGPSDTVKGPLGQRTVGGLLVSFDTGKLAPYVARLPAQMQSFINDNIVLDKTITFVFGGVTVRSAATPVFALLDDVLSGTADTPSLAEGASDAGGAPASVLGDQLAALQAGTAPPGDAGAPALVAARGPFTPVDFKGLPAALVGILLLVGAGLAGGLHELTRRAFGERRG